jgi:hypothetical protein
MNIVEQGEAFAAAARKATAGQPRAALAADFAGRCEALATFTRAWVDAPPGATDVKAAIGSLQRLSVLVLGLANEKPPSAETGGPRRH